MSYRQEDVGELSEGTDVRTPGSGEPGAHSRSLLGSWLLSALLVYSLLGFLSGGLEAGLEGGMRLISGGSWKLGALASALLYLCLRFGLIFRFRKNRLAPHVTGGQAVITLVPELFVLGFATLILSDFSFRGEAFYAHPVHLFALFFAGAVLLSASLLTKGRIGPRALASIAFLLLCQAAIAFSFLQVSEGRLIFSDDHPSFLYRLHLLREVFPWIPFYNTEWNAGYSAREFFPSGSLNLYLLALPFLYFVPGLDTVEGARWYSLLIPYVLMIVIPAACYLAARYAGLTSDAAVLSALLSLGPTASLYEFALLYGTVSFVVSAGLFPLALILLWRLSGEPHPQFVRVVFTILVCGLCLAWHLMAIALVPFVLYTIFLAFKAGRRTACIRLAGIAIVVLLLQLPSLVTLYRETDLFELAAGSSLPGSTGGGSEASTAGALVREYHATLKRLAGKFNPFFLAMFFPALVAVPDRDLRRLLGMTAVWLVLLACAGPSHKPQLELHRMSIPLGFLLCIPLGHLSALLVRRWSSDADGNNNQPALYRLNRSILAALLIGGILATPLNAVAVYGNDSRIRFSFEPPYLKEMGEAIAEHGGDGRTFVSGFILHELGAEHFDTQDGGHIAPLPAFSGKPMYASHFYHVYWSTVDPIPEAFRRRGKQGIEEFLDLIHATAVLTFKREWAQHCLKDKRYTQVWQGGRFRLFKREASGSYFARGKGTVRTHRTGITVRPLSPEVVLKFRYLPSLRVLSSPEHEIFPVPVFTEEIGGGRTQEVSFIGLKQKAGATGAAAEIEIGF